MGEVIITSQDNVTATELTTRQSMFNTEMCCTGRLDRNIMYGVECAQQAQKWYYVKGNASSTTPPNLLDFVKVYFASQVAATFPSDSVLGEIWVTYRVRLRGPVMLDGTDTTITISNSTTTPLPGDLPNLPISIGSGNILATGAYTTLTGSTRLAFTSGIDSNGNLCTNSGFARCAQVNFTKLRLGEVFTITAVLQSNLNYSEAITLLPLNLSFPTTSLQLYSPAVTGQAQGLGGSTTVNPYVYQYIGVTTTNDLGVHIAKAAAMTCQTLPILPGNLVNIVYSWTLQFIGTSASAAKPVTSYAFGTGSAPFYPSTILLGWPTSQSVDSLQFPVSSNQEPGAKSFGSSQWTMTMKSMGIFDFAANNIQNDIDLYATPAYYVTGQSQSRIMGSSASII